MNDNRETDMHLSRLVTLSHIAEIVALGKSTLDTWEDVLKSIVKLMGANSGTIFLLSEDRSRLNVFVEYNDPGSVCRPTPENGYDIKKIVDMPVMLTLEKGVSQKLDCITGDLFDRMQIISESENTYIHKSNAGAPIRIGTTIDGVIEIASHEFNKFSDYDVEVLTAIGNIIGTAFYNARLLDDLHRSRETLSHAYSSISNARLNERALLSRELHDDIGQRLTFLALRLKSLQQEIEDDFVSDRLNEVRVIVHEIHTEFRNLLSGFQPNGLTHNQLKSSLTNMIENVMELSGIRIRLEFPDADFTIDKNTEWIIFRTIQESLTNILKHSEASLAVIKLSYGDNHVLLQIWDNGKGISPGALQKGKGLLNMKERVMEAGGDFSVLPVQNGGTNITIVLPILI